jgi:hypothetical protein
MNIFEFYESLQGVTLNDFGERFGRIEKYAFRLELLQQFIVDDEVEPLARYLNGELRPPVDYNQGWRDLIKNYSSKGIEFRRVRYLKNPISDYTKFEIAWAYTVNIEAGENIRAIQGEAFPRFETEVPILKDYWVFDDVDVYIMEYDLLGKFLGVKLVLSENISPYLNLMKEVEEKSIDISQTEAWSSFAC